MAELGSIGETVQVREWDDYVGQEDLKRKVDIRIKAALNDDRGIDHMLLTTFPGCGKSSFARIIANRMNLVFKEFQAPVDERDFFSKLRQWRTGGICFIDEIHGASKKFQETLLGIQQGQLRTKTNVWIPVSHISFIMATTEPDQVIEPLRERLTLKPRFAAYSEEDMYRIIIGMGERCGVQIPHDVAEGLTGATGNAPRRAELLVSAVRDLVSVGSDLSVEAVLDLADIDRDGLDAEQVTYLEVLDQLGGSAGLSTLCSMLRATPRKIQQVERLLILRGYVRLDPQGRVLTQDGFDKVHPNTVTLTRRSA